jgi:hypothetical protein
MMIVSSGFYRFDPVQLAGGQDPSALADQPFNVAARSMLIALATGYALPRRTH